MIAPRFAAALTILFSACTSVAPPAPQIEPEIVQSSPPRPPANGPVVKPPRNEFADLPHERVDYWVERFSRGDKKLEIAEAFRRKPEHEEMIRRKLRERNMPEELIYLAMAESGFNTAAHSAAGARGIWQLIPDTARRFGLRVDDSVDERLDPEKSTDAALAFLDKLHERFESWYLAAAGYNAGENRVTRIMLDATGNDSGTDADYYRIWQTLPGETRDYVPAMVALKRLGQDPARYGLVTTP